MGRGSVKESPQFSVIMLEVIPVCRIRLLSAIAKIDVAVLPDVFECVHLRAGWITQDPTGSTGQGNIRHLANEKL
jgi:hypothetical protein